MYPTVAIVGDVKSGIAGLSEINGLNIPSLGIASGELKFKNNYLTYFAPVMRGINFLGGFCIVYS